MIMKLKKNCFVFLFVFLVTPLFAQVKQSEAKTNRKGMIFFYFGYNRSIYSKTNLHFTGPAYDFSLYDLKGSDRPVPFGISYINPVTFTVPQYNYRLGYFFTSNLCISAGMDHMKYVVNQNQMTTISGVISKEASDVYAGSYLNQPIQLKYDLLQFEHTNGFNFVSLDVEYLQPLFKVNKYNISCLWNYGIGGIWVVTKTDVRVMGDGFDNDFHIAGYALAGKTGPRIEFKNHFFLSGEIKGGYASIPSVLIKNAAPEVGDHNLRFLEYYIVAGVNFKIKKQKP